MDFRFDAYSYQHSNLRLSLRPGSETHIEPQKHCFVESFLQVHAFRFHVGLFAGVDHSMFLYLLQTSDARWRPWSLFFLAPLGLPGLRWLRLVGFLDDLCGGVCWKMIPWFIMIFSCQFVSNKYRSQLPDWPHWSQIPRSHWCTVAVRQLGPVRIPLTVGTCRNYRSL